MSTSSIQVLGISTEDFDQDSQWKGKSNPAFRVHGRVNVYDQDGSFDMVRINVKGAVKTRIGSMNAIEPLPTSTLTKSHLDFKPTYSASGHGAEEQHLDFVMPLPSRTIGTQRNNVKDAKAGPTDTFVPSLSLAAQTYITRVTALKDRHLMEGNCQVVYWLETELLRSETDRVVRKMSCPIDVSSLHVPLDVEVQVPSEQKRVEQVVKSKSRGLAKVFNSVPRPQLSVTMPSQLGTISSGSAKLATASRKLSIPVTVSLDLPLGTSQQTLAAVENGTLQCSLKAHWYTRRTFAITHLSHFAGKPMNPETVIRSTTVSSQKLQLSLPPLYHLASTSGGHSTSASKYSTSMMLDLTLPESVSSPSVSTELLDISYTLDLSMRFTFYNNRNNNQDSILRPCSADFHLPVTLTAAQPATMLNLQQLDPLSGLVERGLVLAPPPYIS
ncbi:uncharacterized protein A1O9_03146 [Exophiala aquamarina CBS 119918]|uniref:Uncharacterized protein n=1 Tax=Exophiala aquamarina CBS 119918 TaxID=1182545 RepID=A0A072PQF4_9EURO|nr:uncharacterized protein A1O9_03146 [Exophiala aquamarina CBS 119918]KEF61578.1 hypothetical protein A1O9_03146 [Exophiala aquamarina CBS 119918]